MFETTIHWVRGIPPHRLGLMARPRGGDLLREDVASWQRASLNIVVSLLEAQEIRELELQEEPALCAEHGIAFRHFPIPDHGIPASQRDAAAFIAELGVELASGKAIAIHCHAGIGRTGLIAGSLLHGLGVPGQNIFHLLSRSRGIEMPDTSEQAEWVAQYVFGTRRPPPP